MRRKKKYKSSKAEYEVLAVLQRAGYEVIPQFKIPGIPLIFDFYLPALNCLVEYQGSYWHADPKKYKAGTLIRMSGFREKILVDFVWAKDAMKKSIAESFGYKFATLWESDYKVNNLIAIQNCLAPFCGK